MKREEFEKLVMKAVKELPRFFKDKLENVDIIVEEELDMETAGKLGLGSRRQLLGLYRGVPLKSRTHYYGMVMPDKIILFKSNIERACEREREDIYRKIKHVIQHEIAHHFGISDRRLMDLGLY